MRRALPVTWVAVLSKGRLGRMCWDLADLGGQAGVAGSGAGCVREGHIRERGEGSESPLSAAADV